MKPTQPISTTDPDWSRESIKCFGDPGPKLLRAIKRYQTAQGKSGIIAKLTSKYWVINHRFWSVITQCEIHLHTDISGGLLLPHPTGIIIHPEAIIGPNCLIFQQVTLAGAVTVSGHVDFGAGAKILGPLMFGDDVLIGANAVLTKDIPSGSTATGIPAKISKSKP